MSPGPALTDSVVIGSRTAPSRVLFGPHPTNLGVGRTFSARHTAYYARRAAGGAGLVVTETASVHDADWPYERAPSAKLAEPGWRAVAAACAPFGTLVLGGIGHHGLQGSSAFSQRELWAPSAFADPVSRETPMVMGQTEIDAVVAGFAAAATTARAAGLAGVEVDAGPRSLLRQFQSGLTNQRSDRYGDDRLAFATEVLAAVRTALGPDQLLSLRLCCDELAPWAGITPALACAQARQLAGLVDLLVVVRGGPYSVSAYRPDSHTEPTFNRELCRQIRTAVAGRVPVVLQGSVVEPVDAQRALDDEVADLVEVTRGQIADATFVQRVRTGRPVRPCVLCNQRCLVQDSGNPKVSCIADPRSGHETEDPDPAAAEPSHRRALVVGGGPAGLEAARVLAERGCSVRLVDRRPRLGGVLAAAATGLGRDRLLAVTDWLIGEVARLGVTVECDREFTEQELTEQLRAGVAVVLATGSRAASAEDALSRLEAGLAELPPGPVVVHDRIGGPTGVAVAEWLAAHGRQVSVLTPDPVVGSQLAATGDLADANGRLQRAGVRRVLRSQLTGREPGQLQVRDVWTGQLSTLPCAVLIDCGHRLADDALARPGVAAVGDCVAPRTVYEAILEGRRAALAVGDRQLVP